ncbi:hypothetical protein MY04_1749 [Flammeovirga sp. MY04]|uniref:hypothetical protein n=1 Tax=Flammeovirga sp. MY04 TaxID=1191459 RepID=UPI000806168A|nr:hypothetical protein [Flammeovirga sp. MY04]ANQ49123.1 hypothetical protein MY04_1749 [Flammeovirga sp. MY04]
MMDQIQDFFVGLSQGQLSTLFIAIIAIIVVFWKVAKAVIRLAVIVGIILIAIFAYQEFEPNFAEKGFNKMKQITN